MDFVADCPLGQSAKEKALSEWESKPVTVFFAKASNHANGGDNAGVAAILLIVLRKRGGSEEKQ